MTKFVNVNKTVQKTVVSVSCCTGTTGIKSLLEPYIGVSHFVSWGATELNCVLMHPHDLFIFMKYNNQEVKSVCCAGIHGKMKCIKYEKKIKYVEFVIKITLFQLIEFVVKTSLSYIRVYQPNWQSFHYHTTESLRTEIHKCTDFWMYNLPVLNQIAIIQM